MSWVFNLVPPDAEPRSEPRSLRHPEASGIFRLALVPPLANGWHCVDWAAGLEGVVDGRMTLVFDDGARLIQPLAKTGRNRCRAMFRPPRPVVGIEVALAGSTPPSVWPEPRLRRVSAGEQRMALLRRGLHVLAGDPRGLPWRAARFLIQWRRQGRTTIPVSTTVRSDAEAYALWRERFDERDVDRAHHAARSAAAGPLARFTILADPQISVPQAAALRASLEMQGHGDWELFLPGEADAFRVRAMPAGEAPADRLNAALALSTGARILMPCPGTIFRPHALLTLGLALRRVPGARMIYADDDDLRAGVRCEPRFKPAWSPLRARAWDYVGDPCAFDAGLLRAIGGVRPADSPAMRHELLVRATERLEPSEVVHVAQVLSHALEGRTEAPRGGRRTDGDAIDPVPLVSIIIPTRDHADLLRLSVGSIVAKTTYPAFEILVVDNGSHEAETLRLFERWADDPRIRVLHDPRPFNYSALNNGAALQARGSLLALVNNDVEVVTPRWLDEMVGLAAQSGVGCVGAKLHYPDGRLQHGGVVTGVGGAAGHRHKRAAPGARGRLDALATVNEVSAVTGACLLVRKSIYEEVGGLDAETFAVGYNDVDFCLKVAAAGYRNVFTPFAELNHHESVSRGRDLTAAAMERFNREVLALRLRWGERLIDDPYSSPNLTLDSEEGGIRVQ